jgi:hypothetical protein
MTIEQLIESLREYSRRTDVFILPDDFVYAENSASYAILTAALERYIQDAMSRRREGETVLDAMRNVMGVTLQ